GVEIVGFRQRREGVGNALTVGLMTGLAVVDEDAGPEIDALGFGRRRRRGDGALPRDAYPRALRLVDEIELFARIDELVLGPGHFELSQRATVEGALDRMIDDD